MDVETLYEGTFFLLKQNVYACHPPQMWRGFRDNIFDNNELFVIYPWDDHHTLYANLQPNSSVSGLHILSGSCLTFLGTKKTVFCNDYEEDNNIRHQKYEVYFKCLVHNQIVWVLDRALLVIAEIS